MDSLSLVPFWRSNFYHSWWHLEHSQDRAFKNYMFQNHEDLWALFGFGGFYFFIFQIIHLLFVLVPFNHFSFEIRLKSPASPAVLVLVLLFLKKRYFWHCSWGFPKLSKWVGGLWPNSVGSSEHFRLINGRWEESWGACYIQSFLFWLWGIHTLWRWASGLIQHSCLGHCDASSCTAALKVMPLNYIK